MNVKPHSYHVFSTEAKHVPVKKVLAIVNPASGHKLGPKALAQITPILNAGGIEVVVAETTHSGHAGEIVEKDDLSPFDAVLPIGGDGTVHEVVNGLMRRKDPALMERIVLGIIPAGSGNTLAFDMTIYSVQIAAETIVKGMCRGIDVMAMAALDKPDEPTLFSINIVGWAMASKIMKTANAMRGCGCGAMYTLAMYQYLLTNDSYTAKVTYVNEKDEKTVFEGPMSLVSLNTTVHVGARTPISPNGKLDDGLVELSIAHKTARMHNITTLNLSKKGKHLGRKGFEQVKVKEVILEPSDDRLTGPGALNVDGEMTGTAPVRVTVMPRVLKVFTP